MRAITHSNKTYIHEMTVSEFAKVAELSPPSEHNLEESKTYQPSVEETRKRSPTLDRGGKWFGGLKSTKHATDILLNGWEKGANKLSDMRKTLADSIPAPRAIRRRPQWRDDGHTLDVDRALSGQWDIAYRDSRRELGAGVQVLNLMGSFGGNCNRSAEELFWSGAAGVVLCDLLEEAGYQVNFSATFYSRARSNGSVLGVHRVLVKEAGDPMRLDAVAAVCCHAGIFRTLGFRSILSCPWDVGNGLGYQEIASRCTEQLKACGEFEEGSAILEPCFGRDSAIREIKRVLKLVNPEDTNVR